PGCTDLWGGLTADQRTEVSGLLKQLVQKNYKKSLQKTLDYEVNYKDARKLDNAVKVRTEAKNKTKPRDPAVQVDYLVTGSGNGQKVVDMVTEGSSLTKNYYDQFKRMMSTPGQGYPYIVQKLNEKIAKKD